MKISVPHFRVSNDNIQVVITDESVLHFSSSPYLLVLNFAPHCFAEQADEACAKYEISTKELVLRLKKAKEDDIWENLHLLGKLVAPKGQQTTSEPWLQKVVSSIEDNNNGNDDIPIEDTTSSLDGYGFMRMFRNIYETLAKEEATWLEVPWDPSETREERRDKRRNLEKESFDQDRYLQDLDVTDDYIYQSAISYQPFWNESIEQQLESLSIQPSAQRFSDEEQQDLLSTPYPILPETVNFPSRSLLLGLLDILFAYVYDHLTTDGEATVESAWTVTKLSAALSCLEDWNDDTLDRVMISSCRRTLLYPYLRNADLACLCWRHVSQFLPNINHVVRILLQIRKILLKTDQYHYLSNQVWIDPYLAWIQKESDRLAGDLIALSRNIQEQLSNWKEDPDSFKESLDLGLTELEESMNLPEQSEEDSSSDSDITSSEEEDSLEDNSNDDDSSKITRESASKETSDALLDSNIKGSKLMIINNSP